jgi:MFS family permease
MLDSTVANLALESIRADLASTLAVVQWVVTGYLVSVAVSLPAAGWLGSRYGYGRVWAVASRPSVSRRRPVRLPPARRCSSQRGSYRVWPPG